MLIDLQPSAGPALVVGGGTIALRKARNLAEAGFAFKVVAPEVAPEIAELPGVTVARRAFDPGDLGPDARWSLVFACTSSREVNRLAGELAHARNIPVVVADAQDESTFFTPAVLRQGTAAVAVSTGGADPALAAALRDRIAGCLGDEWAPGIEDARAARQARRAAARE